MRAPSVGTPRPTSPTTQAENTEGQEGQPPENVQSSTSVQAGGERYEVEPIDQDEESELLAFYAAVRGAHSYLDDRRVRTEISVHPGMVASGSSQHYPSGGTSSITSEFSELRISTPPQLTSIAEEVEEPAGAEGVITPPQPPTTSSASARFWIFNEEPATRFRSLVDYINADGIYCRSDSGWVEPFQTGRHKIPAGSTDVMMSVWINDDPEMYTQRPLNVERIFEQASMNEGNCFAQFSLSDISE